MATSKQERHKDSFTNFGLGWGLWESVWSLRGFENALMDCVAETDFFEGLLDKLLKNYLAQIEYCQAGVMFLLLPNRCSLKHI